MADREKVEKKIDGKRLMTSVSRLDFEDLIKRAMTS